MRGTRSNSQYLLSVKLAQSGESLIRILTLPDIYPDNDIAPVTTLIRHISKSPGYSKTVQVGYSCHENLCID